MHTIVISTDNPKADKHLLKNLKRLFPECKIKIHHKKPDEFDKNSAFLESSTDAKQENKNNCCLRRKTI